MEYSNDDNGYDEQAPDKESIDRGDSPRKIVEHLDEFRSRFLVVLITIAVISCVAFYFSNHIWTFLKEPLRITAPSIHLNLLGLADGILIQMKVSILVGLLLGIPIAILELWSYIKPAISRANRRFARITIYNAFVLFYAGMSFTYFVLLKPAIVIMIKFSPPDTIQTYTASNYLSFILVFCFSMAILFELPIIIMLLTKIGLVTPKLLITKRKYAIVIIWIVAAFITPQPDPISQSFVAIPLMILYEISIVISRIIYRKKLRKESVEN